MTHDKTFTARAPVRGRRASLSRLSIGPDESVILTDELDELRQKARAHDEYLAAYRAMRDGDQRLAQTQEA